MSHSRRLIERVHLTHVLEILRKPRRPRVLPLLPQELDPPFPTISRRVRERAKAMTGRTPEESYALMMEELASRSGGSEDLLEDDPPVT